MSHLLYTFRRCPYAIRARMALAYANIKVQHYEVDLKNKPEALINSSPKGSVPVLVLEDGTVIEESLDIMIWALKQSDPDDWLNTEFKKKAHALIQFNDNEFKPLLDNYKYPQKSVKQDPVYYREQANDYLKQMDLQLKSARYLLADKITLADVALFPFIRQFYMVDMQWFKQCEYKNLQRWLDYFLNSDLFESVMQKTD